MFDQFLGWWSYGISRWYGKRSQQNEYIWMVSVRSSSKYKKVGKIKHPSYLSWVCEITTYQQKQVQDLSVLVDHPQKSSWLNYILFFAFLLLSPKTPEEGFTVITTMSLFVPQVFEFWPILGWSSHQPKMCVWWCSWFSIPPMQLWDRRGWILRLPYWAVIQGKSTTTLNLVLDLTVTVYLWHLLYGHTNRNLLYYIYLHILYTELVLASVGTNCEKPNNKDFSHDTINRFSVFPIPTEEEEDETALAFTCGSKELRFSDRKSGSLSTADSSSSLLGRTVSIPLGFPRRVRKLVSPPVG